MLISRVCVELIFVNYLLVCIQHNADCFYICIGNSAKKYKYIKFMENLSISDLRLLLGSFCFDFSKFLDDSEVSKFCSSCDHPDKLVVHFIGSCFVDSDVISEQDSLYDRLDLYIKLLTELKKYRPLPF